MTQDTALSILKTGANAFLTGEPGAGKTHTINSFVSYLRSHDIEPAITASTGIAATHIGGMTIHSWSGIGIKERLTPYELDKIASSEHIAKRIRRTKILIIDEISMLGPETLSMVDAVCREVKQSTMPFGGLQVIFVGDFFQLPPVVKRNFAQAQSEDSQESFFDEENAKPEKRFSYDSPAWIRANPLVCYLSEQYRQDDEDFLSVLSAIRKDIFEESHLERIASRKIVIADAPKDIPKLYSHNVNVDSVNDTMLSKIKDDERVFEMSHAGRENLVQTLKRGCLSPETLRLKVGAKVMFTKNNQKEGFVNGTLGEVVGFDTEEGMPIVKTKRGLTVVVSPVEWAIEENGKIRASITQVPLRLAWAITVHKSQGMSLDEAIMDLSQVFEYGQGYVALSRVRRLSGLHILGWNARAFQVHPEVLEKDALFHESSDDAETAFLNMPEDELEKMHENFIIAMGGNITADTTKAVRGGKHQKKSSAEESLEIILLGKNISETAEIRELTEGTIVSHLEELTTQNKFPKEKLTHLIEKGSKDVEIIMKALQKDETGKLKPVFDALKGKYPYEQIRLVRLFF